MLMLALGRRVGYWTDHVASFCKCLFLYVLYHHKTLSLILKKFEKHFCVWFSGVRIVLEEWFAWEGAS